MEVLENRDLTHTVWLDEGEQLLYVIDKANDGFWENVEFRRNTFFPPWERCYCKSEHLSECAIELTGFLAEQAWVIYDENIQHLAKEDKAIEMLINTFKSLEHGNINKQ